MMMMMTAIIMLKHYLCFSYHCANRKALNVLGVRIQNVYSISNQVL